MRFGHCPTHWWGGFVVAQWQPHSQCTSDQHVHVAEPKAQMLYAGYPFSIANTTILTKILWGEILSVKPMSAAIQ